ncbi:hypothetical protein Daura_12455 [Dactylosporangium aurantiacum]|uniref:Uncharacterized protein n=1 Tax=Dactylosporangium aurantiacum TaxID=35754 RepID=A0A9Q9IJU2_9ACTN|nr:hypothetical protein [Dactylosporangium aurantiacum]MDG6104074.1 hypothetical protein [Dactylosporangium aurantiacum]UWZ56911.1 hypothetical protein Daura_12455 [Dactylosporangium aurantiacum]
MDGGEARRLFERFRLELWHDRHWDSEFTPSPHAPGAALRDLVGAGPAAAPLLVGALDDADLRSWACLGLEWLGPAAGDAAATALADRATARLDAWREAAVALDAVAPARARALGVHRWPETMERLTDRHLARGATAHVERFLAEESGEDVVRFLAQHRLRDWIIRDRPPAVMRALRGLPALPSAAEILVMAGDPVTAAHIDALCHGDGPLAPGLVERLAAHPASDRLVPRVTARPGTADALWNLVMRRRCAGLTTDPAPLRPFLRACVADPPARRPGPRFGAAVPSTVAWLGDEAMLVHLLPMLREDRLGPPEWHAAVAAVTSFAGGAALLEDHARRHPDVERLRWALDAVAAFRRPRLEDADDAFLRGRIESTLGGAFTAYAAVLLGRPSAPAAFQLAWIDRAFGAPVTADRVAWIRGLGFTDDGFLAELSEPVERPLEGLRLQWDAGEPGHDPARAARAAAAGLPSLARRWLRDDTLEAAAGAHLARVHRAAPPPP